MSQSKLCQVAGVLRERPPAQALQSHIHRIWINAIPGPTELEVVPDGCIDIYWTGEELRVAGPNTKVVTARMGGAATLVGLRFWPGVALGWLRVSALEFVNAHLLLEEFWGLAATARLVDELTDSETPAAAAAMLENALVSRLHEVGSPDPIVSATLAAASREVSGPGIVRSLTSEFGWSERTLRRRCHEAFGYGPKTLERILRFQRFLRLLDRASGTRLSVLAAEAGYADQAHLAREVRRLSGHSPSRLVAELQSRLADSFKTSPPDVRHTAVLSRSWAA